MSISWVQTFLSTFLSQLGYSFLTVIHSTCFTNLFPFLGLVIWKANGTFGYRCESRYRVHGGLTHDALVEVKEIDP